MVKILFFILFLIGIIIYPVIISKNKILQKHGLQNKKLPDIEIIDGIYNIYNKKLEKNGTFESLKIYNNKNYIAYKLKVFDLIKKEYYKAKKTIMHGDLINGYTVFYKNSDFDLNTSRAIYNTKTKILKGGEFILVSNDYKGRGKEFKIDKNKNIDAKNITYYIKVKK